MTPEVHAAVERLRDVFASGLQSLSSIELRTQCLADLALLVAAADAGAREQASGAAVTGENSSHDHGNCALCEHLDVYWRKQLATATARVQALEEQVATEREKLREWTGRFEFHEDEATKTITALAHERDTLTARCAALEQQRTCWMIERSYPHTAQWWDGQHSRSFTADPQNAIQFSRREDARTLAATSIHPSEPHVLTEHVFIGRALLQPEAPRAAGGT